MSEENPANEFAFQTKAMLSWAVIAEMLNLGVDLSVAELHPMDGQYDCLSLVDSDAPVMLNRAGSSALVAGEVVSDIWAQAAQSPPRLAEELTRYLQPQQQRPANLFRSFGAAAIGGFLATSSKKNLQAHWGWSDSSQTGSGPVVLPDANYPKHWMSYLDQGDRNEWQKNIWFLSKDDALQFIVHLEFGQAIRPDGQPYPLDRYVIWEDGLPHSAIALFVTTTGDGALQERPWFQPFTDKRPSQKIANEAGYKIHQQIVSDPARCARNPESLLIQWLAASNPNSPTIERYLN
jgi:hypothetical protein